MLGSTAGFVVAPGPIQILLMATPERTLSPVHVGHGNLVECADGRITSAVAELLHFWFHELGVSGLSPRQGRIRSARVLNGHSDLVSTICAYRDFV